MDGADLLRWGAVAVVTLVVVVTALLVGGFAVLFRRRGDRGIRIAGPARLDVLSTRAGGLLVRLDDAVREADEELGYAIAQFGPERSREFAATIAGARAKLTEAFRLRHALDDAQPDTERERRAWTNQIIVLCESAQEALDRQDAAFAALRRSELGAGDALVGLRERIAAAGDRVIAVRASLAELAERYDTPALSAVDGNPDAAAAALAEAAAAADAAEPGISASGVSAVTHTLARAAEAVHRAEQLLDAVDTVGTDLAAAADALAVRRAAMLHDLVEAKAERDRAPDAETGEAIIRAIVGVEAVLRVKDTGSPASVLDALNDAVEQLDLALASARNQASRLEHARLAYESTLVFARSQIAAAQAVIGGAGVAARTRLAEAQRQLGLAQIATDPVEALDTVRRAVTHARDAEDLARYGGAARTSP